MIISTLLHFFFSFDMSMHSGFMKY